MPPLQLQPVLLLLLLLSCSPANSQPSPSNGVWTRVLLQEGVAQGAVCLSGSPGGYYIRPPLPGAPPLPNSFLVFFEGEEGAH
jgi:hypothetical protein